MAAKLTVALLLASVLAGCARSDALAPRPGRTIALEGARGTRPDVGVPGRIDHMAYDPQTHRLFVAALENGSLEVLDLEKGVRLRSIGGLEQPQGVAVVPTISCAVLACGGDGRLHVYDTRTLEERSSVEVGPDADNVRYDAKENRVYVAYGTTERGAVAVFDPGTWKKAGEIPFASHPESFQLAPEGGRLFANIPGGVRATGDGSVAAADRNSGAIEAQARLEGVARNFPMAFDASHGRLFVASRRPARLIELDARSLAIVAQAPCTDDSDDLFYDAQTNRVIVIGGGFRSDLQTPGDHSPCSPPGEMGAIDVFSVGPKGELTRVVTTPTAVHARTGFFVPSRRALYVAVPLRDGRDPEIREYRLAD
jgi:hypothetical protein